MRSDLDERRAGVDYADYYAAVNDLSDRNYDSAAAWYRRLLSDALRDLPADAAVLDVGCGAGLLVNALRSCGFVNVSGVDASESLVRIAAARGLPVRHVPADFVEQQPAAPPARYDAVFLLDVLEHIPVPRQLPFLRGLHRLLRPAGRLVVSVPNANSALAARWRYNDWTHAAAFTEHSLRFVLQASGFERVRFLPHEFFTRPSFPFLIRRSALHWWLHRVMRGLRRLQAVGELGAEGWSIPLSLNLLAAATRDDSSESGADSVHVLGATGGEGSRRP